MDLTMFHEQGYQVVHHVLPHSVISNLRAFVQAEEEPAIAQAMLEIPSRNWVASDRLIVNCFRDLGNPIRTFASIVQELRRLTKQRVSYKPGFSKTEIGLRRSLSSFLKGGEQFIGSDISNGRRLQGVTQIS